MPSLAFPALGDVRADGYSLWTLGSKLSPWVTSRPAGLLPCLLSSLKMSSLDGGTCLVPGCQHRQARSCLPLPSRSPLKLEIADMSDRARSNHSVKRPLDSTEIDLSLLGHSWVGS